MLIEAKNISVQYGHQVVLNNLTFHINKGDYLNIIGPNGSGKTTLIKILTGLQKPTSGEITHASVVFGYLPQHLRDANKLPVTVYEVLRHSNLKKSSEQEIDSLLSMMSIEKLKHQKMSKLSGGEQQRVYIIRALLSKPECLILDEPTSALDPKFRKSFYDYIEKLKNMYSEVESPVAENLPLYYELLNHEYKLTSDESIVDGKIYYVKNS